MVRINPNVISRFRNCLVHLINRHAKLPKFIVIIPEDDLLNTVKYTGFGVSSAYAKILDWLVLEFYKIISGFKDRLPAKCTKIDEPHMVWIQTTRHSNYNNDEIRGKFNNCMRVIAGAQDNTAVYFLQQLWERKNSNLVMQQNGYITFTGIGTLWGAVDRTIKYAVSRYQAKIDKARFATYQQNKNDRGRRSTSKDRRSNSRDYRDERRYRRLPSPPMTSRSKNSSYKR